MTYVTGKHWLRKIEDGLKLLQMERAYEIGSEKDS
jgi:hypothetical protein